MLYFKVTSTWYYNEIWQKKGLVKTEFYNRYLFVSSNQALLMHRTFKFARERHLLSKRCYCMMRPRFLIRDDNQLPLAICNLWLWICPFVNTRTLFVIFQSWIAGIFTISYICKRFSYHSALWFVNSCISYNMKVILVTGGTGLVGKGIQSVIASDKREDEKWIFVGSKDADLWWVKVIKDCSVIDM